MPKYRIAVGGNEIVVSADSPEQAAIQGRLKLAGQIGVQQAEAGAQERSAGSSAPSGDAPYYNVPPVRGSHFAPTSPEGLINLGLGLGTGVAANPPLAAGMAKDAALFGAAEGAERLLGLPSWMGEMVGLVSPARQIKGALGRMMASRAEKAAAATAAASGADDAIKALKAKELEQRIADRAAKAARDAERHELQKELLKARLEGRAVPRAPKPKQPTQAPPAPTREATAVEPDADFIPDDAVSAIVDPIPKRVRPPQLQGRVISPASRPNADFVPDEAVSVIADPIPETTILPAGKRAMATNLGGKAKPGPAPTPEVDLEDVLRRSIEAAKAKKAGAVSPLRGPRLEIGAERVGKGAGMTKEEVRLATGPRLDEALGEASPILPDMPLQKIIDTMKALPKTGGAREAYVARATSGKTKWQVENIRRTLEHLGLLAPVAVAGGMAGE